MDLKQQIKHKEKLQNDPEFAEQQLQIARQDKRFKVIDSNKKLLDKIGFTEVTKDTVMPESRYTSIKTKNPNANVTKINSFDSINNLDLTSRMAIGNSDLPVASAGDKIDYISNLSLFSITTYLQSRKYLHGRYLEENGTIIESTHPIFKFKNYIRDATIELGTNVDKNNMNQKVDLDKYKYLLMNADIRKEEKQTIIQNEFQREMVNSSYLSGNVRVNVFAFCFGVSGGYGGAGSWGEMGGGSSNEAKINESTQFIRAKVTITPQCLEYTGLYMLDKNKRKLK